MAAISRHRKVRALFSGLLGRPIPEVEKPSQEGALVYGTPRSSPAIASLLLPLERAGAEGYVIRSVLLDGKRAIVIAANSDVAVSYGAFHFLRLAQTRQKLGALDVASKPGTNIRVLNHLDNLDGHVERGFAVALS